jgi:hypothetical protein
MLFARFLQFAEFGNSNLAWQRLTREARPARVIDPVRCSLRAVGRKARVTVLGMIK